MKDILKKIARKLGYNISKRNLELENIITNYSKIYNKYLEFTMIPSYIYTDNLTLATKNKELPGDVVECGVWRGGMIAGMAEIIGISKDYYLFDSFEGLPEAKEIDGKGALAWQEDKESEYYLDNCKAAMKFSTDAMNMAGIKNYTQIKGWFNQTLPNYTFNNGISILRLDADWYESTMVALEHFYPQVNSGGLIIIDDYYVWDGCTKAVYDYLSINKLSNRIFMTPNGVAYIIK